jgi:glycerol kinase
VSPGATKITFGTGGMLDTCTGAPAPHAAARSADGTFPIVAWSRRGDLVWGIEAIMLSAGTNVEWLVDDLNILAAPADSHAVAAACDHTGGVVYVPALMGLGTPHWDFGARGSLFGLTRGTARPEIVRAVLEGVAHRGADLIDAARADLGSPIHTVRVDGGMTANPTFLQAVAGLAVGDWAEMDDIAAAWSPSRVVAPARSLDREQWSAAVARARRWIPDLSALDF